MSILLKVNVKNIFLARAANNAQKSRPEYSGRLVF
jgi:hypothetical protein